MVNKLAPELFKNYTSIKHLAYAKPEDLFPFIKSVRGFEKRRIGSYEWLRQLAKIKIYRSTIEDLTALPGIAENQANVIIREAGGKKKNPPPPKGLFTN